MKVPIEGDDMREEAAKAKEHEAEQAADSGADAGRAPEGEPSEEDLVEAAKRAGEQAAEADFKADADKVRQERDDLQHQLDEVADKVAAAQREAADSADRLARLQADWDNYRRRTAQERLAERERAAEKLVLNLLPVLDDMERASAHATQTADGDEAMLQFVAGVDAVHDKMVSVLGKEGVEVIDPAGEPFDPLVHQAVGREENAEAYDETVAQVYQRGYRMGGKVIRTAMVTVTYGGPKRPEPEAEGKPEDDATEEE